MSGTPPLQNCEPIETKLRKKVQGCWRELLRECKEKDPNKQGEIPGPEFLGAPHSAPRGAQGRLPARSPPPGEARVTSGSIWGTRAPEASALTRQVHTHWIKTAHVTLGAGIRRLVVVPGQNIHGDRL